MRLCPVITDDGGGGTRLAKVDTLTVEMGQEWRKGGARLEAPDDSSKITCGGTRGASHLFEELELSESKMEVHRHNRGLKVILGGCNRVRGNRDTVKV